MNIVKDLWSKTGTISMPDGISIPIWGYAESAFLQPQIPGPIIEAVVGDVIQINLYNQLNEPSSIMFPGQNIVPTPVKNAQGRFISYTAHAEPGDNISYSFTAQKPGVFLYESGTNPGKQIQMGMYGMIIVRPVDYDPLTARTAYGIGTESGFDVEQVLILNEVDSKLHNNIASSQPYDLHDYKPDYWTFNGRSYPHSIEPSNSSSQPYSSKIDAQVGGRILIRCINAGFQHHNIRFENLISQIVGIDSIPLKSDALDKTYEKNTVTIASGESYDLILTANSPGKYVIYDRDYNHTVNVNSFPGGMMTLAEII